MTLFLLFLCNISFGQISLRAVNYRPAGELGFTMKPLISAEIGWQSRFSKRSTKRFRHGMSIMYLAMKPRMEVFPTYGVLYDGNGTTVIPSAQAFQKYAIFQVAAGSDFAFIHKKQFNVFVGADLIAGAASIDYTSNNVLSGETYQGGSILAGFRGRLGAEYRINDQISVFLTVNHHRMMIADPLSFIHANDVGLGARYSFN